MNRDNHYEAAFEAYLRSRGIAVMPIDEAHRSELDDTIVKSPDFIVVGPEDARLVVDVKGRKFPGGPSERPRRTWENWSTRDDIDGLGRWAARFGPSFRGVLAFVYHVLPSVALPDGTPDAFTFRERQYLIRGVSARDYARHMRLRSSRWQTVHLATATFRELVQPFSHFLTPRVPPLEWNEPACLAPDDVSSLA